MFFNWPNGLAWELLEELRRWKITSDSKGMIEMRVEFSKAKMKRKDDPEVLSSVLSAIKSKCKDAGVSVDETELVTAFIAAAPKD